MNLCHKCRKETPAPEKKYCFDCLDKIRDENRKRYDPEKAKAYQERRRELYREHKEKGICIRCSNAATHGLYCYECSIKTKRQRKHRTEWEKLQRHERGLVPDYRRANKLCLFCGEPIEEENINKKLLVCKRHQQMASENGKKNGNSPWRTATEREIEKMKERRKKELQRKIDEFKEYLIENERSNNTINSYMYDLKAYFETYNEVNKKNMLDFKQQQIMKWKPKTAHHRVVSMNQYCKFIGHPEYCVKSIKIHNSSSVENVITVEEYNKLLEGLKKDGNMKGYYMIKYLAKTGARVSEFIEFSKSALEKGYMEMWTKGKIRRIYIPDSLIEESKDFFEASKSEYLFTNRFEKKYTTRGISENIKRWAKKYGIRPEAAHPHSFRHLYAIEFLKRNSNISLLADLMGHSSVSTTSIYLRLSKEEQIKQFNEAVTW